MDRRQVAETTGAREPATSHLKLKARFEGIETPVYALQGVHHTS